jgi:hypothetical protein
MRSLHSIAILSLLAVIGSLTACRKSVWTKREATDWYAKNSSMVRGGVGYQGSDAQSHHFIARVMDEWVFIQIPTNELRLDDERPFSTGSSAQFAYYAVDPSRDFQKLEKTEGERSGAASRGQPVGSKTNRTSAAAGPGG